jgi:hypothetical protein
MTRPAAILFDSQLGIVTLSAGDGPELELTVPALFGAIEGAEPKGEFVVVRTEGGRVSFHADTGKMHWHSMKKALRAHCLLPAFARRVDLHITSHQGGAHSGWITLDKQTLHRISSDDEPEAPRRLGALLAEYLSSAPEAALRSDHVVLASLALLDRRLDLAIAEQNPHRFDAALWRRFHELRGSEGSA